MGILVIGVWGIVLQRIFAAAEPLQRSSSAEKTVIPGGKAKVPALQPDTFELLLNYKDPFGAEPDQKAVDEAVTGPVQPVAVPVKPPVVDLLDGVVYLGYMLNPATNKQVAILQAGGQEHMVAEGGLLGELRLTRVGPEAVSIIYKGKTKQIKRKR